MRIAWPIAGRVWWDAVVDRFRFGISTPGIVSTQRCLDAALSERSVV
jgi:hypothetical protein